ncbi:MAG: acyl-CoA-binding protein [Planctomycetes bacterium]|nr:acyl-CoA-binding protein [Planctomycetota bacterium]
MDLKARFEDAAARVKTLTNRPTDDELREIYSLYKQATAGDVSGKRPGLFDLLGRAKYDAWAARKGMSSEAAMEAYVALVDRLVGGA